MAKSLCDDADRAAFLARLIRWPGPPLRTESDWDICPWAADRAETHFPLQISRKIGGVIGHARMTKLVLTFSDSQTAQQFSGWLEQNTVTVEVPYDEQDNIIEEAKSRNGRVERE